MLLLIYLATCKGVTFRYPKMCSSNEERFEWVLVLPSPQNADTSGTVPRRYTAEQPGGVLCRLFAG